MLANIKKLTTKEIFILVLFFIFLMIYLLPGIYGHTPWKQDENYSFGIIQTMYETSNWLVPTNAGEPFMEKPPIYYWTATIMLHLLSDIMPMHDAARTATLLFSLLNFSFFMLLARRVFDASSFNDPRIWLAFSLYACAPGLLRHSHDMFTDTALIAGATMALYGLSGLIKNQKLGYSILWLSLGLTLAMLAKGVFVPGVIGLTLLIIPIFQPDCRRKSYWLSALIAGIIALILILPWPVMLYLSHPEQFYEWFWINNFGRFFGFSVDKLGAKANLTRIPAAVLFFAFPSGILAIWALLRSPRKILLSPSLALLAIFAALGVILLQISASGRALYLLPFIAPMAILAVLPVSQLPIKILTAITRFSTIFWSILIILVWVLYFLSLSDSTKPLLSIFKKWLPMSYEMHFSVLACGGALLLSLIWLFRRYFISADPALKSMQHWLLGMTVVWGIIYILLVGWIDYAKGYKQVFIDMKQHIATHYQNTDCMASYNIGESEAPMLYYFAGILHHRQPQFNRPQHCRWLITFSKYIQPAPEGMKLIWAGHRPDEEHENLVVYQTITP
ncbi:hypothetical protein V5049_14585 [Moellerella wisconsensis]|nr:hypothetical protein [Moellerella wisconsensis]UNH23829.1 hypothetical protein MNY68_13625 [Moellerella wisconsensis]